jgi:hypothetical protein
MGELQGALVQRRFMKTVTEQQILNMSYRVFRVYVQRIKVSNYLILNVLMPINWIASITQSHTGQFSSVSSRVIWVSEGDEEDNVLLGWRRVDSQVNIAVSEKHTKFLKMEKTMSLRNFDMSTSLHNVRTQNSSMITWLSFTTNLCYSKYALVWNVPDKIYYLTHYLLDTVIMSDEVSSSTIL